ncbi:MAG: hypothetical protein ACJAT7_002615 [Psychromonas sp.]|jgi:hypothetical protein
MVNDACFHLCLFSSSLQYSLYPNAKKETMNRKKKMNSILDKRIKQMNAKKNPSNKAKYISKAERAKLDALESAATLENSSVIAE